jgi:cyclopropane fatty-acyl-phospholipid synthase-like methyltransferase
VGCGHGATACDFAEALGSEAVGINISPFQVQDRRCGGYRGVKMV